MTKPVTVTALFPDAGCARSAAAKLQALRAADLRIERYQTEAGSELSAVEESLLTAQVDEPVRALAFRVVEDCGGRYV